MNRKSRIKSALPILTALFLSSAGERVQATPYASGLTNNAGTVSFYLNENADNVKVILNGGPGGTNDLGALVRGKYSFLLGTNTTYAVAVTRASGPGYKSTDGTGTNAVALQISSSTNRYLNLEQPRGLKVNRNPSSRYFGRIYAANGGVATTALGRPMQRGIYMVNPDQTSAHPAGQEDTALTADLPSVSGGSFGTSFPYELAIGQDDNLYFCDWTDSTGNLWVSDPEVSSGSGAAILKPLSALNTAKIPVGIDNTHGSVNAAYMEGSLAAGNLKVWTIDEDLQLDPAQTTTNGVSSLWRYDVNAGPLPYTTFPTKVWTPSGKQGIATSPQTMDMTRSTNGNFYIIDFRSNGNESGLAIVDASGTPLWNSWTASQTIRAGIDLLAASFKVAISSDDKFIAVARSTGFVWVMPLTNGLPDLSKRVWLAVGTSGQSIRGLAFDAASNLYIDSNSSEQIKIFSPGGTTVATTANDSTGANGSFSITAPATTVTVAATIPTITESGGSNGVFTITRVGDTGVPLTVPFTITGTATSGSDYTMASGSVTIAAFSSSTNITVTPLLDVIPEATETVILTLAGGAGYSVGSPGSATVSILDDETPEISFVAVTPKKLLESYAPSRVTYQLTRRGLLTTALTVNLSYSGTATRGSDFTAPLTVSIPAGAASASVTLAPLDDQIYEGDETVVITVASGGGYAVGAPSSISATIVDDETPAGPLLFSDNFETVASASLWTVNIVDPSDAGVEFAYNYGAVGIPPAPGSSTTLGVFFRLNWTNNILNALSISPANIGFTGDYRLKFNMWINYNGPMPDGGNGSTQNFDAGVGTAGDQPICGFNPFADGVWFTTTGDGADGNTGGDYDAFIGPNVQNDDTGFYAAGTGAPNGGIRNSTHSYYSFWGGIPAPDAQLALFPGQSGVTFVGNAGMAWHTVVITKVTNTVSWAIDGIPIVTVTNDPINLSTNIFIGYQDIFSSGTVSDKPEMSFGLADNLRVEAFVSAPLIITGISIVGGNVEVTFTGPAEALPAAFKLQSASAVAGSYADDNSASITSPGAGSFKATTAVGGAAKFYRIKF
ncbi:MAG: Calx-beta domain protein [Pedosphaera sp.]|nr:Calx-beta domain protein [Pedosphaera sp.]